MNICFFSNVTFWHGLNGGMEIHGRMLCEGLADRGHDLTVISSKHPDGKVYDEINGIRVYFLKDTVFGSSRGSWLKASKKKFLEIHDKKPFDLVISQQAVVPNLWDNVKSFKKVPVIICIQGHEGLMLISETTQIFHHKKGFIRLPKIILFFCYYFFREFVQFRRCDRIIAGSDKVRRSTLNWFKLNPEKVVTVYNGVDLSLFKPAPAMGRAVRNLHDIKENEKAILFLSHVTRQKGVDVAIRAFAEILRRKSNLKLMIVGGGDYLPEAKNLVQRLRLNPSIIFTGAIDYEKVPDYINAGDILLLPTIRQEGLPLVIIDAMACGKPVVASNIGGNSDALEHGKTGLLTKPGSIEETVKSLERLLDNAEFSRQLAQNALNEVKQRFSEEGMIQGIERVLEDVSKGNGQVAGI
jgi:glycosyltransferase involved in cell wall biosynthesis